MSYPNNTIKVSLFAVRPKAILSSQNFHKGALLLLVLFTFWDGLWAGAPRGEQVVFLHQLHGYSSFWALLTDALLWTPPPEIERYTPFRPVWNSQLAVLFYFFEYDFFKWQLASVLLHVVVVLGVYKVLIRAVNPIYPWAFLLSALFACSFIGAEMVLWGYASGYITFAAFGIYSLICFFRFRETNKKIFIYISLVLATLSALTFQLGVVICLVLAKQYHATMKGKNHAPTSLLPWFFAVSALICFAANIAMVMLNETEYSLLGADIFGFKSIYFVIQGLWFAVLQLLHWLVGWLIPYGFDIQPGVHATFYGYKDGGTGLLFNVFVLTLAIVASLLPLKKEEAINALVSDKLKKPLRVLFLYSCFVVIDVTLPNGLEQILKIHVYYAYLACLAVIIGFLPLGSLTTASHLPSLTQVSQHPVIRNIRCVCMLALAGMVVLNCLATRSLATQYRYDVSTPQATLINKVTDWVQALPQNESSYFVMHESCEDNKEIPWFSKHHFKDEIDYLGKPTVVDALFPSYSHRLNQHKHNQNTHLIVCSDELVQASSQHMNFGPEGLFFATNPGWHASVPVTFPQHLEFNLGEVKTIKEVSFLPQSGEYSRAPKAILIESKNSKGDWMPLFDGELSCNTDTESCQHLALSNEYDAQLIRVTIHSNCGDHQLLTLRGIRFD